MNYKELYSIREWAPLTNIIERIPEKVQKGFFPTDLNITCVDAVAEFIALGSDGGIVFWYNRHTGEVQKLKAEVAARITCVKIVNSVEFMVAAGNSNGQVSVFQIQKELPPDLDLVAPCTRLKPIERYTIRDLHRSSVSCCEWSKNGMKLYSGDREGIVVLTEFDYQAHLSKSVEILSEAYEIVQLSVYRTYLLVSTLYRSIVCQRSILTGQWQLTQVGKKDRKQLVDCGGTFLKGSRSQRPSLICGRPGLRFWVADAEGNVERTLLFRDAVVRSPTWRIPILNPKFGNAATRPAPSATQTGSNSAVTATQNFHNVYLYAGQDALVVTHDQTTLYILNLDRLCVEAVATGFRKILDFCVCEKEIFVLEGDRSLLRLAPMPEKPNKTAKIIFNPSLPPPVPQLGATMGGTIESPVAYEPSTAAVINAEECFELPPIEQLNLNVPIELAVESPRAEQNRRLEIFKLISELDFDQSILHHSDMPAPKGSRRKRRSRDRQATGATVAGSGSGGIVEIAHAALGMGADAEDEPGETAVEAFLREGQEGGTKPKTTKPTLMDVSYCTTQVNEEIDCQLERCTAELAQPAATAVGEEVSQAPTVTGGTARNTSPTNSAAGQQLSQAYPKQLQVEDAGVQTTPRKKYYYLQEAFCDYSAGEPIDDVYQTLRSTALAASSRDDVVDCRTPATATAATATDDKSNPIEAAAAAAATVGPDADNGNSNGTGTAASLLQFVPSQPVSEDNEIDSFLLDFRRARDPLHKCSPPPSGESTTSSEWEFLDN